VRYLHGVLWILIISACRQAASVPEPDLGPPPEVRAEQLSVSLQEALQLWRATDYPAAEQTLREGYEEHFEPLEPALSAQNPQSTLALEYAFGRLGWRLQRSGKDAEVVAAVEDLSESVAEAAAELSLHQGLGTRR
jgi:hypothetical protein